MSSIQSPITINLPVEGLPTQDTSKTIYGNTLMSGTEVHFSHSPVFDTGENVWRTVTSTSGQSGIVHLPNESATLLGITNRNNAVLIRESKSSLNYQPDQVNIARFAAVWPALKNNLLVRAGIFDGSDGFYFQSEDNTFSVVRSTTTSGGIVRNIVNQANWNLDTLDGNGPSGITLDLTKIQLFSIEFSWYGVGPAKFGLFIDGKIVYVHSFSSNNLESVPIVGNPDLPLRIQLENEGNTSGTSSIKIYGSSLLSIGNQNKVYHPFTAFRDRETRVNNGQSRSIIAIRPKSTYKSKRNTTEVIVDNFSIVATRRTLVKVVYNPTISGSNNDWEDVGSESCMEYNPEEENWSGGQVIQAYMVGQNMDIRENINLPPSLPLSTEDNTVLAIVVEPDANADVWATINWREVR